MCACDTCINDIFRPDQVDTSQADVGPLETLLTCFQGSCAHLEAVCTQTPAKPSSTVQNAITEHVAGVMNEVFPNVFSMCVAPWAKYMREFETLITEAAVAINPVAIAVAPNRF